jgi:hypothetical protein
MFILKNLKPKTNLFTKFVFVMIVFLIPVFVNAQVVITEIMYDPEKTDSTSGGEWVEVQNIGSDPIDLTKWFFFEGETNHRITSEVNIEIMSGEYAIISKDLIAFKNYFDFSDKIFKASFTLGIKEKLVMKSDKNEIINENDFVVYDTFETGEAKNNGNSLQLINGEWKEALPTPGAPNVFETPNNQTENTAQEKITLPELKKSQIFADAGKDKTLIAGADTQFKGMAYGLENKPIENARFSWSFGDGSIQDGQDILHNYKYPGEYVVVLNISSGEYSASDRILVKALPADIVISDVNTDFIELKNNSDYELNLSWWRIRSSNQFFTLPKDTIILSNTKLKIPSNISGFYSNDLSQMYILYPNGEIVNKYNEDIDILTTVIANDFEPKISTAQQVEPLKFSAQNHEAIQENQNLNNQNTKQENNDENKEQMALVGNINQKDNGLLNKWTFSLMGLILFSIAGFFVATKFTSENEEIALLEGQQHQLKPEDFKII